MTEPHVDFATQLGFYPTENYAEGIIYSILGGLAERVAGSEMDPIGSLVVLGNFEYGAVPGMSQMKPRSNPINRIITIII